MRFSMRTTSGLPEKLELQTAALQADPKLDMVFCGVEQFHGPELSSAERARLPLPSGSRLGVLKSALLARRSAFDRVGRFDEATPLDFPDWYARAQEAALREAILPQTLVRRRVHASNAGRQVNQQEYAAVLARSLKRRGGGGP